MSTVTLRVPSARASGANDGVIAEIFRKSLTTLTQLHGPSRCSVMDERAEALGG